MDTKLLRPQWTAQALDPRPSGCSKGQRLTLQLRRRPLGPYARGRARDPARGPPKACEPREGHTWRGRTWRGRTWRSALPGPGTPRSARGPAHDRTCRPAHPTYPGVINLVRSLNLNVQGGPHFDTRLRARLPAARDPRGRRVAPPLRAGPRPFLLAACSRFRRSRSPFQIDSPAFLFPVQGRALAQAEMLSLFAPPLPGGRGGTRPAPPFP